MQSIAIGLYFLFESSLVGTNQFFFFFLGCGFFVVFSRIMVLLTYFRILNGKFNPNDGPHYNRDYKPDFSKHNITPLDGFITVSLISTVLVSKFVFNFVSSPLLIGLILICLSVMENKIHHEKRK